MQAYLQPSAPMPPEYWQALLDEASVGTRPAARPVQTQRLCDINRSIPCGPQDRSARVRRRQGQGEGFLAVPRQFEFGSYGLLYQLLKLGL